MISLLIELLVLFLFLIVRWKCRILYLQNLVISFRHWEDVNIGAYLIRRESLQGLLAGGHLEQLPLLRIMTLVLLRCGRFSFNYPIYPDIASVILLKRESILCPPFSTRNMALSLIDLGCLNFGEDQV